MLALTACYLASLAACADPLLPAIRSEARSDSARVPEVAPDTVPAWVFADSNLVRAAAKDLYYANVLMVRFRFGTARRDRQSAIDGIGGTVVGGRREPDGDGIYLVRVEARRQLEPLMDAARTLRQLPQIWLAAPVVGIEGAAGGGAVPVRGNSSTWYSVPGSGTDIRATLRRPELQRQ